MIRIDDLVGEEQFYSVSGLIEFEIFYNRITHLVKYYNHSLMSYYDYLDKKSQERKFIKDNIQEILKSADSQNISVTEDELFTSIDDEILGIKFNYQEYQKMTLIIILFSEVEKLIDNIIISDNTNSSKKINGKIEKIFEENGIYGEEKTQILSSINSLRFVRNKLVHRYDHWDDEFEIRGHLYKGLNQLSEEILGDIINNIISSIKKIDECYIKNEID